MVCTHALKEYEHFINYVFVAIVSTMQRMVNQCNTPQDSPDLKKQL